MRAALQRICVVLGMLACTKAPETPKAPAIDPAADIAAIDALRNREISALSSGNVDSIMTAYSNDVDMMAPDAPAAHGAVAVREMVVGLLKDLTLTGAYTSSSVEVSGDMAVDRYAGTLTMTPRAGGPAVTELIKGIHVLRRQADGSWKIIQDVWNVDGPPPSAPKSK